MDENPLSLPVEEFKDLILGSIEETPVIIITAETGAGKSTRIPLWLWEKGKKVIVTQPRRIAARSLSYYLSGIIKKSWGEEVGYQTGFDQKRSKRTELLYLTDGVQLINEIKDHINYDVLILDEVHEWNLNQEILVGVVKKRLNENFYQKKGKKVIIMSATLEAGKLSKFLNSAPVITVPGRGFPVTMHNNSTHFLLSDTVSMVESWKNSLVFLPGKKEISDFITLLRETLKHDKIDSVILPLHSELNIKHQSKVFDHYDIPKVVVSTDIAQTSLTIDDIDSVIDNGIKKEIRTIKGIEGLYPVEISRSESLQRAGRAGRVKNGQYILCSDFPPEERQAFPEPEIRRLNLESVILKFLKWGIDPVDFPFFHSPKKNLITKAVEKLRLFGAIDEKGDITNDGKIMADLPISVRGGRLLLEVINSGKNAIDSGLKIIALIETKGIVGKDYIGEIIYSDFYSSDLLNQLYLWNFSKKNRKMINLKKLEMAKEIYRELKKRIDIGDAVNIKDKGAYKKVLYRAILSSFSDNLYVRSGKSYFKNDEERQLDRNSVLFKKLPGMVVALPFDLIIDRENRFTGDSEKVVLPLLTFSTEVSLEILDELRPFGYKKLEEIKVENGIIDLKNSYFFGGRLVEEKIVDPPFSDKDFTKRLVPKVLQWWKKDRGKYELFRHTKILESYFPDIKKRSGEDLKGFQFYFNRYLVQKIEDDLNTKDLDIFFNFHLGFKSVTFSDLLPPKIISELKKKMWPESILSGGKLIKIRYFKKAPYLELSEDEFEIIKKEELLLPTGEKAGIVMDGKRLSDWDYAVYYFNRNKKVEIFRKKWKNEKKEADPDDIIEVVFPVPFEGGTGKENEKFIFYSVPEIIGEKVYLKHFFERNAAEKYFGSIEDGWKRFQKEHKSRKIKDIFHKKGWKVK